MFDGLKTAGAKFDVIGNRKTNNCHGCIFNSIALLDLHSLLLSMLADEINIRYIGGPTALFQIGGLRFITDPTFDEKNTVYETEGLKLKKLGNPLIAPQQLDKMDFVLLTNGHHYANLDHTGKEYLNYVEYVFTTPGAAAVLGSNVVGLNAWQEVELATKDGRTVILIGIPCEQHPIEAKKGPATGFLLYLQDDPDGAVYITGTTLYTDGMKEVASRFNVRLVIPFLGAALAGSKESPDGTGSQAGSFDSAGRQASNSDVPDSQSISSDSSGNNTKNSANSDIQQNFSSMTVMDAIKLSVLFDQAIITPLQFEGWAHYTEGAAEIQSAFASAGLMSRLKWPYGFNTNKLVQKN